MLNLTLDGSTTLRKLDDKSIVCATVVDGTAASFLLRPLKSASNAAALVEQLVSLSCSAVPSAPAVEAGKEAAPSS